MILNKPYTNREYADFAVEADSKKQRIEITDEAAYALYDYEIVEDGEIKDISNTQEYLQKIEDEKREKISKLSLSKREFLLTLYTKKGVTPEDIKEKMGNNIQAQIEFDYAERFYRNNPLFDNIGATLGITAEELDEIFLNPIQ